MKERTYSETDVSSFNFMEPILAFLSAIAGSSIIDLIRRSRFPHKGKAIALMLICFVPFLVILPALVKNIQEGKQDLWLLSGAVVFGVLTVLIFVWLVWRSEQEQGDLPNPDDLSRKRNDVLTVGLTQVTNRIEKLPLIIPLEIQDQPLAVNSPNTLMPQLTKSTTSELIDVFKKSSKKLLVLGKPGSGKTILLLELTQELLHQAREPGREIIPIFMEATNWNPRQSLSDWIQQFLNMEYRVPEKISRFWLQQGLIIPLIDGLDELGFDRQGQAILLIDEFIREQNDRGHGLVVSCRIDEFEHTDVKPCCLDVAVSIQPLNDQQIEDYLKLIDKEEALDVIRSEDMHPVFPLEVDDERNSLPGLRSPLLLNIMLATYNRRPFHSHTDLFNKFIQERLKQYNADKKSTYSEKQLRRYLGCLARKLENINDFEIESLQPRWLEKSWQIWIYRCLLALIGGLIYGPFSALFFGIFNGAILGFLFWLLFVFLCPLSPIQTLKAFDLSLKGIERGLIFSLKIGLTFGLFSGLIQGAYGFIGGLLGFYGGPSSGLLLGLFRGSGMLIFGLAIGLTVGLRANEGLQIHTKSNQGVWDSIRDSIAIFIINSIVFILLFLVLDKVSFVQQTQGLRDVLLTSFVIVVILVSLLTLFPVIQHVILRFLLWCSGNSPWNYADFLDYVSELRLIQDFGGRYRFLHGLLRKHIADTFT